MLNLSNVHFDSSLPYWQDYLPFLLKLAGREFPACDRLNDLLPDGLSSECGHPIRFVPSTELDDAAYEQRIYTTGQVSTRPSNWHDLFNAMVWMRFPSIKSTMNTLHYHAWSDQRDGRRGRLRDALTLFDECGVIVFSNNQDILNALAGRRLTDAFLANDFNSEVQLAIVGHAMLEKFLSPYKSMTAKAMLIKVDSNFMECSRQDQLACLDREIAARMLDRTLLIRPACLAPLPLAGVPGWWANDKQNDQFYQDSSVFRPPPANLQAAPVHQL